MHRGAKLSKDGIYRTTLVRCWNDKLPVMACLMLNPSKADARIDDPTMRKVIWFAGSWHFGGVEVVNFAAYRATKPAALFAAMKEGVDIIGPDNVTSIASVVLGRVVLCAWGANVRRLDQRYVERVKNILRLRASKLVCLGMLEDGTPVHPLYQAKDSRMRPFTL